MNRVGGTINPYLSSGGLETTIKGSGAEKYARWLVEGRYGGDSKTKEGQLASIDRAIQNDIQAL